MRSKKLLWLIITAILLTSLWLSTIRRPLPAMSGTEIHAPTIWHNENISRLRVSTFNIHKGEGLEGRTDISRTAKLLADDDISGLQEVRAATFFDSADQAEQIAKTIDSGWIFAPIQTRFYQPYIGNALLSRLPVKRWQSRPLIWSDQISDQDRSRKYRNMLIADIIFDGNPVTVITTHLDRGDIRESQLQFVLEEFDRHDRAILMGDLNSHKVSPTLSKWLAKNPRSDAVGSVLGGNDENTRIDWILIRGFNAVDGGATPSDVSDHPYYWVALESNP